MDNLTELQQKGLFTFYREQDYLDQQLRKDNRKKKKSKSKKSKKKTDSPLKDHNIIFSKQKIVLTESLHDQKASEQFLKNVVGRYNKMLTSPSPDLSLKNKKIQRLKCEPSQPTQRSKLSQLIRWKMQKAQKTQKKQNPEFGRLMFRQNRQKNTNSTFAKELEKANDKIHQLHNKIIHSDIFSNPKPMEKLPISKIQPIKLGEGVVVTRSCKNQNKSFMEKIKYLDRDGSCKNMNSGREHPNLVKNTQKVGVEEYNKDYFKNLIHNFYNHHGQSYKFLNHSLKFPHIRQEKTIRFKTQEESPVLAEKKAISPIKSFSTHKRSLKLKSQQKFQDIYRQKMTELKKQPVQSNGKLLNFIDMSKDYGDDPFESEDNRIKKKLIRMRLGTEK